MKLVPMSADSSEFYPFEVLNLRSFLTEEDLLYEALSCNTEFVLQSKNFFAFQVTIHIGPLKEDYYV